MLAVSVLGPLEVRRSGVLVPVPGGKTSELLVRLAVEAGTTVRTDRLLEELWADDTRAATRNTLQSKIAKLRRALGDPGAVVSQSDGYRLVVDPALVDALAAVEDAAAVRRLLEAGDHQAASQRSGSALARFRGDLLADAGDATWVGPHRARLATVRLQLFEAGSRARLALGDAGGVITDIEAVIAEHPYEEHLWELLVTALYGAGRPVEALAAYQRVRARLAEDLGLAPGPRLQALEQQILRHDPALAAASVSVPAVPLGAASGVRRGEVPAGNLPPLAVDLVGRDAEIDAVTGLLVRHRLVEIVGPGGVGKTALALAVGRGLDVPAGVWLVRLEAATTGAEVIDATVAALGVTGGEPGLVERLRALPAVLVLDNCEHVLDMAAAWAERLLDAAAGVRLLCTSQAPLDLPGSVVVHLDPLAMDDAVALFTRRAAAQRRSPREGGDDGAIHELCAALDGLPLAIELAAARTRTLSPAEIFRRLDDRFVVLRDPASRHPVRRRALRAAIAWSYDLLFPDDQRGLWALATFAGGASLAAAEFVMAALDVPPGAALDVIERLVVRSLVVVDDATTEPRYRLLDSIRAFAREAMADAGRLTAAHDAHARWFVAAAAGATDGVRGADQATHLASARVERPNIDAALAWGAAHDPAVALSIAQGFGWSWVVLGDSRGAERLVRALDAADAAGTPVGSRDRAGALLLVGWIEASIGHLDPARTHLTEALALAESAEDALLQARGWYHLAYVVSHQGDFREGLRLTDRSRALLDELDRPWDQVANALFAARAAISAGDEARAVGLAADVGRWLERVEDPWLHTRAEAMFGELARLQHRFDDAVTHIGRAVDASHRLGFRQTEAYQVASLGRALCQAGRYDEGAATLAQSVAKAEATGDARMAALARVHLGRVLRALGRAAEARTALAHTVAWHRAAGGGEQALLGECLLAALDADVDADAGDDVDAAAAAPSGGGADDAHTRLAAIADRAIAEANAPVAVFALDALARLAAVRGECTAASALLAQADEQMAAASHFIAERDRVDARAARAIRDLVAERR